ncbi:DUF3742 family protein [Pseudomonas aeruginosa]|uniref:DUF3742 family protein n=1 Tax=Pseudomonas aeruginosa TaxID=287 RepID=UPI0004D54E7A|nr:DUF3742 family protein [Pseudomonas aeruginosa]KEA17075.1 hypothetical protein BH78_29655 [Pseudomonas aeruginosa C1913C]QYE94915.1 DUF3742 family protein [Pseudomonas aeruginosa]UGR43411.1 DUF3742 family protein [Pseudomonas aeruginosa]HCI3965782.1 DUF3742 family protein [Pseudomonas aeruginosa]HCL3668470.1 DUF3742 family protein [Pseudomonas aeruginosa]
MRRNTAGKPSAAWELGRWCADRYRAFLRQEARFVGWLAGRGVPVKLARVLPWIFRIVAVLALLYLAFWMALVFLGVAVLAHVSSTDADHDQDWVIPDPDEHMKNPGYDPNLYNDPPDPSYYDARYDKD